MNDLRVMLRRFRRKLLGVRVLEASAWGGIVGGVVSVGVMVFCIWDWPWGVLRDVPAWLIPVVLMTAGGVCGALTALLRGVRELQAARVLDQRYDLKEHLATASELLAAGDESSEAAFVYAQATQAARALPRKLNLWRCTRRLPAILMLTLLLCGAMLLLPDRDDRLAEQLLLTDARQRQTVQANLRESLRQANPDTQRLLADLTRAIEVRDEDKLRRILEKLRQAGVQVREILTDSVSPATLAGTESSSRSKDAQTTPEGTDTPTGRKKLTKLSPGQAVTKVYHPRYRDAVSQSFRETRSQGNTPISMKEEPTRAAWKVAQARAAKTDRDVPVPGRYRNILKAFTRR